MIQEKEEKVKKLIKEQWGNSEVSNSRKPQAGKTKGEGGILGIQGLGRQKSRQTCAPKRVSSFWGCYQSEGWKDTAIHSDTGA